MEHETMAAVEAAIRRTPDSRATIEDLRRATGLDGAAICHALAGLRDTGKVRTFCRVGEWHYTTR